MTSKEYIFSCLESMVKDFPQMTFSYKYHNTSVTHFIHVNPIVEYDTNELYQLAENSLIDAFISLYPKESIAFVSDDSLVKVLEPEMIFRAATKVSNDFHRTAGFIFTCIEQPICAAPIYAGENNYALAA
jgi:hypothetical protein